jgi:dUTP pyrophosphatase
MMRPMSQPIQIQIKRLENSVGVDLPTAQSEHAAGLDLHAAVEADVAIAPGEIKLSPCGFAMAVPVGYEAQVRPRSGLAAKFGISMPNAPGTIDADYRGQVCVPLINHGHATFIVTRNMRIAQMLIKPVYMVAWDEVDELPDTTRGAGGFGHTGH